MTLGTLLPIVVIIAIFWFLIIRPQMRRSREARDLQSTLAVGDHVMLTSGIYAEVTGIGADYVLVQLAEDVIVRMARGAILRVLSREELVKAGLAEPLESEEAGDGTALLEGTVVDGAAGETRGAPDPTPGAGTTDEPGEIASAEETN